MQQITLLRLLGVLAVSAIAASLWLAWAERAIRRGRLTDRVSAAYLTPTSLLTITMTCLGVGIGMLIHYKQSAAPLPGGAPLAFLFGGGAFLGCLIAVLVAGLVTRASSKAAEPQEGQRSTDRPCGPPGVVPK